MLRAVFVAFRTISVVSKKSFRTIKVSNTLDPDQARQTVCKKLSAVHSRRGEVKLAKLRMTFWGVLM